MLSPRSQPYRKAAYLTRHPRPTFKNDYQTFKAFLPTSKTPFKRPLKTSPSIPDLARPQFTDSKPPSKPATISSSWSLDGLSSTSIFKLLGTSHDFWCPSRREGDRPGAVLRCASFLMIRFLSLISPLRFYRAQPSARVTLFPDPRFLQPPLRYMGRFLRPSSRYHSHCSHIYH
ncbi:hypothetical protein B0H16DRAFT_1619013, partial [Mycena metata]